MHLHDTIISCMVVTVIGIGLTLTLQSNQYIEQQWGGKNSHDHCRENHGLLFAPKFDYKLFPASSNVITTYSSKSFQATAYTNHGQHRNTRSCRLSLLYYLSMLLIMQSGDLHPNPGPYKPKYPCNICYKAAKWGQRATCCDKCDQWYHVSCMSMSTHSYELLQNSNVSWICNGCGSPNYANSLLFSSTCLDISNSFSCLSNSSDIFGFPLATSSPQKQTSGTRSASTRLTTSGSTTSPSSNSTSQGKSCHSSNTKPKPKTGRNRKSLKFMNINFGSIKGKVAELAVCIENYCPDVIIGTETHLDNTVNSSELFPADFSVIRKDRDIGNSKGGVLIALRNDLVATHRIDLDTKCEIVWVTIKIQGAKDLTIGSFYRSQQFGNKPEYFDALRESLDNIKKSNGQILLGGDFNLPGVDWDLLAVRPGGSYANLSRQMLDITSDFGLEQVVRKPTRGNNILDLFFTSNPTLVERSWVVPGISDHDGIPVIIVSTKPRYIKQNPRKIYLYQKADIVGLKSHLKSWADEFTNSDVSGNSVNAMYNDFQGAIEKSMDLFIPSKIITKRNTSPWINRKVKRYQKRKQRAYNSHRRLNTKASLENFNSVRKSTQTLSRNAYRRFVKNVCSESSKKFYGFIKCLKFDTIGIPALMRNGNLESDNRAKAEVLNTQFCSVFTQENPIIPPLDDSETPPMPNITISVDGVLKLLENLDPNKSSGPDGIPARILKLAAEELAPVLSIICQKSLDTGEVPDSWLRANITPIFKKGDRTLASNYRPVSLTSICSKIMEHIIHSNIMKHFSKHTILTDKQHGFRQKHSCETQLILTMQDLTSSLDNKSQVDMVILDFSKAFDVVPHNLLLSKLHNMGIQNSTLTWISSFLKHRTQRVVVSGEKSAWSSVISGVPQGTVLGPLLFLAYINDLPENIRSSIRLFADDCVIYREIVNDLDSDILQQDLLTLGEWEKKWQMKFNYQKCFVMRITHKRSPKITTYTLDGVALSPVENHPYLGVTITNNLSWNRHIQETCSKANRSLGFIKRNLYSCNQSTKLTAYRSLVRPLVEYSSAVWDPYTKQNIDKLEAVQKRAARFILNDYKSRTPGCATQMVKDLGLEPLTTRRKARRLCIFQKSRLGQLSLPIGKLLQPVQRQSRHHHPDSYTPISTHKDCYKHSFVPKTICDWNSLPPNLITITDPINFKTAISNHLQD